MSLPRPQKAVARNTVDCLVMALAAGRPGVVSSRYRWPLMALALLLSVPLLAQSDTSAGAYVHIDTILFEGNRHTRKALMLRELDFSPGDSIRLAGLTERLELNKLRLLNLELFTIADLQVAEWRPGNHLALRVRVTETWYLLPVPLFELADRNFNVWWKEFGGSLRRVNYGIDLTHNNLTGNADALKAKLQFGYNNRYEMSYRFPPFDRRRTLSLRTAVSYSRAHEVAWRTEESILRFRRDPEAWQMQQFAAFANLSWRPGLLTTHHLSLEYRDSRASDSVAVLLNPDFFLQGRTRQHHASLIYNLTSDHRDIRPYPLNGWLAVLDFRQNGLLPTDNLWLTRLFAEYSRFTSFGKRWSVETALKGRISFPRRQPPYFNNQALGYAGNFVRGYEYYVADGLDFGILKTSVHFELFNREIPLGRLMPFTAFKVLPLKIYLALNNDLGYANDPHYAANSPLSNRLLYGRGVGLDLVAWYNKTARFEYSWNDLGEGGLYVRINTGF